MYEIMLDKCKDTPELNDDMPLQVLLNSVDSHYTYRVYPHLH